MANNPKKGDCIKVEPIKTLEGIANIKKHLARSSRDLAIFTLGINSNLRASDILALTVGQVKYLRPGDDLLLKEKKTSKHRHITINNMVYVALQKYLVAIKDAEDSYPLFASRKGGEALTVSSLNRMVKGWCDWVGLKGNYGSHTLRKTFGYMQRIHFKTPLPVLMQMFNHSSQRETMIYLCIQPDEIRDAYMNEL